MAGGRKTEEQERAKRKKRKNKEKEKERDPVTPLLCTKISPHTEHQLRPKILILYQ